MRRRRRTPAALLRGAEGQWRSRVEIRRVLETFDSSGIDTATLATLVAAGYADLAVSTTRSPPTASSTATSLTTCAF